MIVVRPLVIAGVAHIGRAEGRRPRSRRIAIGLILLAAVKHDMQLAALIVGAACRNIKPAISGHAMTGWLSDELALIEIDERAPKLTGVPGVQVPIDPLQQLASGIIVAVADERITARRAWIAEEIGRHRMLGGNVVL